MLRNDIKRKILDLLEKQKIKLSCQTFLFINVRKLFKGITKYSNRKKIIKFRSLEINRRLLKRWRKGKRNEKRTQEKEKK